MLFFLILKFFVLPFFVFTCVVYTLFYVGTQNYHMLKFNTNTLEEVRKEYGLNQHKMEQAIDILQEWIKKQEHFTKKDFSRDYLERVVISTKGSVERAKVRVDKLCTMRTMLPEMFEKFHSKNDFPNLGRSFKSINMPNLGEDNYRICIIQFQSVLTSSVFMDVYKHSVIICEYLKSNDYSLGAHVIIDVLNINLMDLLPGINFTDLRNIITLYTECYGFRIKSINIISTSKMVDALVNLLKQVLSAKLGQRIQVLKSVDSLHEHFPKHLLPKDYGGEEKSISALYDEWTEELSSEAHVKYMKEMQQARTNESLRRSDKFNEEYLGMPGSFKVLSVD